MITTGKLCVPVKRGTAAEFLRPDPGRRGCGGDKGEVAGGGRGRRGTGYLTNSGRSMEVWGP